MNTKLDFLTSRRFWGLVAIAIIGVLNTEGIIPSEIAQGLIVIISGFIGIRTIDKFGGNISK